MGLQICRRPLGTTGLFVSEIGFGALEIGRDWAADVDPEPHHLSESDAIWLLNQVLDVGINFIDTAPAYWHSEEFIGKAISNRREEYILATKVGEHCDRNGSVYDYSREATHRFIDQSLKRLRTETIDLIQIHSASLEVLERGETWLALDEARRAGKVRHIGMTGGVQEAVRAIKIGGYETVQVPYNLLAVEAEDELFPLAREHGVGVIVMRGLAGGKLSTKFANLRDETLREAIRGFQQFLGTSGVSDLAHLALAYVLGAQEVSTVIAGTRKIEHLQANIKAAQQPLAPEVRTSVSRYARSLSVRTW